MQRKCFFLNRGAVMLSVGGGSMFFILMLRLHKGSAADLLTNKMEAITAQSGGTVFILRMRRLYL